MKYKNIVVSAILIMVISGCAGTAITRQNTQDKSVVGGYPYKAVVYDVAEMGFFGICCIPLDFIIDTICLPIDLVTWPFGCERPYPPYEYK